MTHSNVLWLHKHGNVIYFRKNELHPWKQWDPELGYNKDWEFRIEKWE